MAFYFQNPMAQIYFLSAAICDGVKSSLLLGSRHQLGKDGNQPLAGLLGALPRLGHDNSDAPASRARYCLFGA